MQYRIDYAVAGLLFLAIYYIFLKLQYVTEDNKSNKIFSYLIAATFWADLLSIITTITVSYADMVPRWINYLFTIGFYLSSVVGGYFFDMYIRYRIYPDGSKKIFDKINNGIICASALISMTTWIHHLVFYFDSNNEYTRGVLFNLMYAVPLYFITYALVRVVVRRDAFEKKSFYIIFIFTAISIFGGILQILVFPNVLFLYFFIALGAFMILFSLETPDYVRLEKAMNELSESKDLLEKANEREIERTRTIHQLMGTASWVLYFDENGNVSDGDWSDEFLWMLGYNKEEVENEIYEIWSKSLHPQDYERAMRGFMDGMFGAKSFDMEYRLRDKNGAYKWYRGTGELKTDAQGNATSYQGIIRDINEEKQREVLKEEKLAALEELEKSEKALKDALAQAESANEAKSRFLSNMSHDIRTPMNAIVGFTDLAIANVKDEQAVRDYLDKIQISGNHLLALINDILDMSRIESGKVTLEENGESVVDLVKEIDSIVSEGAKNKGLSYSSKLIDIVHPDIYCDKLRLKQVLINCIGNSIKFTPKGGDVSISVRELPATAENDSATSDMACMYEFVVSDTGIGMTKEFLKHIFEPFERERTSTIGNTQGTGLGMSITKNLVEMMNGSIDITSALGEGTTTVIKIPLRINNSVAASKENNGVSVGMSAVKDDMTKEQQSLLDKPSQEVSSEIKEQFLKGKHFLLVDDNSTNRLVARGLLKSKGITVEEAENGDEAVMRLKEARPGEFDGVLMDLQMPVMSGFEATDIIRGFLDSEISSIPILAMTANAFEEDRQACLEHGMNGHIAKPFKIDNLIDTLYDILYKED